MTKIPMSIDVDTQYIEEQSKPEQKRYAFAYTISINNLSHEPVKLLTRHWIIRDGNQKTQEIKGEGVVGEQPIIPAGDSFCYTSGAILETPIGTMEGSYQMLDHNGDHFDLPIPCFPLLQPGSLH
jgi:ApaG protein